MTQPEILPHEAPEVGVILPCTQEEFGAFISKLLGRPQVIRGIAFGVFDIARQDVENTYHLIDQRVQQNGGTLVEFNIRIGYDDNSSVELRSLAEFAAYREVRQLVSNGLTLSWTYIIRFPGAKVPEKQTIDITFSTTETSEVVYRIALPYEGFRIREPHIRYEIAHTNRTWGADMESLIDDHISTLVEKETGVRTFVAAHRGWFAGGAAIVFIVLSTLGALAAAEAIAKAQVAQIGPIVPTPNVTTAVLSQQVANLSELVANGRWHRFGFMQSLFFIVSLLGALLLSIWVSTAAENTKPSFLQLTDKSIKERAKKLEAMKKGWWNFIASLTVTVATGTLTRVVFFYVSKWWLN